MPIVQVKNKFIQFPENMNKQQITDALRKKYGYKVKPTAEIQTPSWDEVGSKIYDNIQRNLDKFAMDMKTVAESPNREEAISKVMEWVGPGALSFRGIKGLSWDPELLKIAQDLEKQGQPARPIMEETGLFKDLAGNWKGRIDDTNARFSDKHLDPSKIEEGKLYPIEDIYGHEDLYKEYPDIAKNTKFKFDSTINGLGQQELVKEGDKFINVLSINPKHVPLKEGKMFEPFLRKTMAHEMGHAVQDFEGWAGGSSAQGMHDLVQSYKKGEVQPGTQREKLAQQILEAYKKDPEGVTPFTVYRNTLGEMESRQIEKELFADYGQLEYRLPEYARPEMAPEFVVDIRRQEDKLLKAEMFNPKETKQ